MKKRLIFFNVCMVTVAFASLYSQSPPTLTLKQAEQTALKRHPAILQLPL